MVAFARTMPTGMSGKEKDENDDDKREENNKSHENKALGCALKHAINLSRLAWHPKSIILEQQC